MQAAGGLKRDRFKIVRRDTICKKGSSQALDRYFCSHCQVVFMFADLAGCFTAETCATMCGWPLAKAPPRTSSLLVPAVHL